MPSGIAIADTDFDDDRSSWESAATPGDGEQLYDEDFDSFSRGIITTQPLGILNGHGGLSGRLAEITGYEDEARYWEAEPRYYEGVLLEPTSQRIRALGFTFGTSMDGYWKFTTTDGVETSAPVEPDCELFCDDFEQNLDHFVGWIADNGERLLSVVWVGDDGDIAIDDISAIVVDEEPPPACIEPSELCLIVDPDELVCGEFFTVRVAIDSRDLFDDCGSCSYHNKDNGGENDVPVEGCGDGFEVFECENNYGVVNNIAGVVSGKIGLTFTPGKIDYKSAMLGGVGPAVHVPTSAMTFASQGDGWVRFSFSVPTPPDNTDDPNAMINGRGVIATFTFKLPEDASSFQLGIDPAHTEFLLGSSDPPDDDEDNGIGEGCPIPCVAEGYPEDKWPIDFPQELFHPWITCGGATQISGTVKFWGCMTETNVPFTKLTLLTNMPSGEVLQTVSDSKTGEYTFNVSPFNNYQLAGDPDGFPPDGVFRADDEDDFGMQSFGGTTDVRNAITAADVGQIMLHWNDPIGFPLNACKFEAPECGGTIYPQRVAADVDAWLSLDCDDLNDDVEPTAINGADASILQQVIAARILGGAAMPEGYPLFEGGEQGDCVSNWKFFCANKTFGLLPEDGVEYDPVGVLIGDVNGSYLNDPNVPRKPSNASLAIPVVSSTEKKVLIPVELRDASSVIGVEAKILYDQKTLRFVRAHAPVSVKTDEPTNHAWAVSNDGGALALVVTGLTAPLTGSSTVALLEFERVDMSQNKASSPILIATAEADDAAMKTDDGFFTSTAVAHKTWGEVKSLFRNDD